METLKTLILIVLVSVTCGGLLYAQKIKHDVRMLDKVEKLKHTQESNNDKIQQVIHKLRG
jgi:hypothetical protein